MTNLPFNPDWTVHPGELVEMFMEDLGIDRVELASRMGCAPTYVDALIAAGSDMNSGTWTTKKLGEAFDMPQDFWTQAEAEYRKDLIRLTPKRVGLFEDWESFAKVDGNKGADMANRFVNDVLAEGDRSDRKLAAALKGTDDFIVLAERYEDRLFFQVRIESETGTYMAFGPKLVSDVLAKNFPSYPLSQQYKARQSPSVALARP